jgi:hypothetical protein
VEHHSPVGWSLLIAPAGLGMVICTWPHMNLCVVLFIAGVMAVGLLWRALPDRHETDGKAKRQARSSKDRSVATLSTLRRPPRQTRPRRGKRIPEWSPRR